MLITETLKKSILQAAIQGKLTQQLPSDGNAKDLLAKIKAEKQKLIAEGKIKKEKPLAPITDDEKPFEIPENWEWVKINEIAFVTKLAGFEYTSHIAPHLTSKGVPLFKGKNVQNGELVYSFESYIPQNVSDELPRSQLTKKCLLTPYVGTIGNIAIFDGKIKAHLGSNVGKIEFFNETEQHILEEYMLLMLRSPLGLEQLSKHKKSTAQESISIDAIRDSIVLLPPLAEQKRIVERVEELFAEIEKLEKDEKQLEELQKAFPTKLKNSLLQAAMQGKLTEQLPSDGSAKELLTKIKAEKQKLIAEGKIKKEKPLAPITDDEKPFEIPENWSMTKAGNVFTLWDGQKVSDVNLPNLDAKFLRTNANATYLTEGKFVKAGQTMILVDGENSGEVFIPNVDGIQGSTFKLLEISKAVDTQYAMFFLSFYREYLRNNKKGAAIPHLNKDEFKNLIFPLPPLAEQKRIVEKLEELLPLCEDLGE